MTDIITLAYVKHYPNAQKTARWRKKRVNIYNRERGYWRPQASGYANAAWEAWNLPFETALAHTASLHPNDHPIEFHLVDTPGNAL